MNNYENNVGCCNAEPMPQPRQTLTELMGISNAIGNENLSLAKLISNHFFGNNKEDAAPKKDPFCFVGVMEEHCDTLKELHEVLCEIVDRLGCQTR